MKTSKFFWTLLATASLCMGCQKESNPLTLRDDQISQLVNQAENESDQTAPSYNSYLHQIEIAHLGLSFDYLTTSKIPALCGYYIDNDIDFENYIKSNFRRVNWESFSSSTKQSLENIFQKFENKQRLFIYKADVILHQCNDSLAQFIFIQEKNFLDKQISKKDYDSIMTGVPDTFMKLFRSTIEEYKIRISCSANYRQLLLEIQNTLTETQWEEFFQCMHRK